DLALNPASSGTGAFKNSKRVQHRLDPRNFVRAEQIRFAERGQHGEERLGAAHFLSEILEGVGQGVADRKAERAQPECIEEDRHLMAHSQRAVLKVAVVKAETRIDE